MLPLEHSAILLTCTQRLSVLKTIFGVLFKWPLKTGFIIYAAYFKKRRQQSKDKSLVELLEVDSIDCHILH